MITLKEIARKAQVSIGTVDRVIHGRGRVSPETEKRIKKIIKELDYKANKHSRSHLASKSLNIGIVLPYPMQDGHFWEVPIKGIEIAQRELDASKIKLRYFYYDKYSEKSFNDSCERIIEQFDQINGLIIAPVLAKATEQFLKKVPSDLSYVFLDSYIDNSRSISYVGEDSYQSGVIAGQYMKKLVKKPGVIAIINILPIDYHIEDRIKGFRSIFENNKDIETKIWEANTQEDAPFYTSTERILADESRLIAIFAPNACSYQVAQYLNKHEQDKKIWVFGYDVIEPNIVLLKEGSIDFLVSQRSEIQGYESVNLLYKKLVLQEEIESKLIIPSEIVTKKNLHLFIN